jgi:hypothetical protein
MTLAPERQALDAAELTRRLRQCRHTAQSLTADLTRARTEIVAAHGRAASLAAQLDAALLRTATLAEAVARLEEAVLKEPLPVQPAASFTVEASLRAEIEALSHHRGEAQALRQSTSWRLTRPLRALAQPGRVLRALLGRGQ